MQIAQRIEILFVLIINPFIEELLKNKWFGFS